MSEWSDLSLDELATMTSGKPIKPGSPGPIVAFGSNGIIGGAPQAHHERGIIVGRVGAYCGSVALSNAPFWASDNTIVLTPRNDTDLNYLYYLLLDAKLNRHAGGAAQPLITQTTLKGLTYRVPVEPVRIKVGQVLRSFDELIENNRRRIALLEQVAQAIYREWFVHFRYPGHESNEFIESGLGPIPGLWETKRLGDVGEVTVGGDWGEDEPKDDDWVQVACVRGVDIRRLTATGETEAAVRWIKPGSLTKRRIADTDVIIEGSGDCGNALAASFDLEDLLNLPVIYSNFCKRMRFPNRAMARYVGRLLNEMVASNAIGSFVTGTAMPNLNLAGMTSALDILVPPMTLLQQFDDFCVPLDELRYDGRNRVLRNIRDLLLPKLVSGAIDVSSLDLDALLDQTAA